LSLATALFPATPALPDDDLTSPSTRTDPHVSTVRITLEVLLITTSILQTLLILLHKGKGGGMSDMFGGGVTSNLGGSSVAERNLDRFTIMVASVWVVAIVGLGLVERFTSVF
jgi:preprotein translocase subunit SecG